MIGPGNRSAPVRHQAINYTNFYSLSMEPLETEFSEILIKYKKSFKEMNKQCS